MSLHERGFDGERTAPLPAAAPPPWAPGPPTPPIWSPPPAEPPPPSGDPGPYSGGSPPGGNLPGGAGGGPYSGGPYSGGPYSGGSLPGGAGGGPYSGGPYSGGPPPGGSWTGGAGGGSWRPTGGGWQPPGMPPPPPSGRGRAVLVAVAIVLAVILGVVAGSYALVGGPQPSHVATSSGPAPSVTTPAPTPSPVPSISLPPVVVPTSAAPTVTAPAPPRPALTAAGVAAAVDPSTVDVVSVLGAGGGSAAGTGMVLTANGVVLTNNHVIDGATSISVQVAGTTRVYAATLVNSDPAEDVAVIQLLGAAGMKVAPFGDSAGVAVGDSVVALGNALGRGGPPSLSQGTVVGLDRAITATDPTAGTSENLTGLIQTSAALQPGDSGGPLANTAGQVIGMDTAASSRLRFNATGGVGFAIPINHALQVAARLRSTAGPAPTPSPTVAAQRGILGVDVQSGIGGAYVAGVVAGSPAEAAGIMAGDTIVNVDGAAITSPSSLTSVLSAHRPGDVVRVTWVDPLGQSSSARIRLTTAQG